MLNKLRVLLFAIAGLLFSVNLSAQKIEDPTKWTYEIKKTGDNTYQLIVHLKLQEHWHIWSMNPGGDGFQIPPSFEYDKNPKVQLIGKTAENGKKYTEEMDGVDGAVSYYKDKVDYVQEIKVTGNTDIKMKHEFQVCDDEKCLPPTIRKHTFSITDAIESATTDGSATTTEQATTDDKKKDEVIPTTDTTSGAATPVVANSGGGDVTQVAPAKEDKSLLWLFLAALGGGIAAVLTPCVYSMIPITVSFFTKRSKTRAEGIRNAVYYSLSIIFIFTILGILISVIFGANALNTLSTNWIANLFFFVIFVIFGISFLGAFEITLPSSWTSKTDSKAGLSSFSGIFFMALTLAIVSFSCTGPIVGPLLVLAGQGGILGPAVGMFGFSIGLALPFALFAIFPGMLNKMASSGGWLNQVKVVLGFLELMLALKFLSNADLAMGWRLLDREIFLAIWIVLAVLLGFYLLGKLKLSHDDETPKNIYGQEYVSIFKLFLAIVSFSFAVYLVPGMWGAPLNGMSAFVPPMGTQDFILSEGGSAPHGPNESGIKPVKYVDVMKIYEPPVVKNMGLETFYDYQEAIEASKKLKKPIMLDFTGINCVNCRKMESQVWSQPEVAKRLKEDFIVASLYCDINRIQLPEDQQYFSKDLNSEVMTLGNLNADLQASKFGANSQPFYFYIDADGVRLAEEGYPYDPDVQKFIRHLDNVKAKYKELHP